MRKKQSRSFVGIVASAVLFVVVFVVLSMGTSSLSGSTNAEGVVATQQAIERATVLCYATEGFYPPGVGYLEENYGVQIDHDRYVVQYDVVGANVMPTIRVVGW